MMRSLYSGVAGLKTHQTKMDVIGNNIANVNTTSYKSQSITFSDLMYQTTQTASGATETKGGVNARQIGLGAKSGAINTAITAQGATQTTNNPFDIMITGESFFVVSNGTERMYTRDGSFYVDGAGNLAMQSNGYLVQGWAAQEDRETGEITINKNGELTGLQLMSAANYTYAPASTTAAIFSQNIDARDTNVTSADGKTITLEFYDNKGYLYTGKFTLKNTEPADDHMYALTLTDIIDSNGKSINENEKMYDLMSQITFGDVDNNKRASAPITTQPTYHVVAGSDSTSVTINKDGGDVKFDNVPFSGDLTTLMSPEYSRNDKLANLLKDAYGLTDDYIKANIQDFAHAKYSIDNSGKLTISSIAKDVPSNTDTATFASGTYTYTDNNLNTKYLVDSNTQKAYRVPERVGTDASELSDNLLTDVFGIDMTQYDFSSGYNYTYDEGTGALKIYKDYDFSGGDGHSLSTIAGQYDEFVSGTNKLVDDIAADVAAYGIDVDDLQYSYNATTGELTITRLVPTIGQHEADVDANIVSTDIQAINDLITSLGWGTNAAEFQTYAQLTALAGDAATPQEAKDAIEKILQQIDNMADNGGLPADYNLDKDNIQISVVSASGSFGYVLKYPSTTTEAVPFPEGSVSSRKYVNGTVLSASSVNDGPFSVTTPEHVFAHNTDSNNKAAKYETSYVIDTYSKEFTNLSDDYKNFLTTVFADSADELNTFFAAMDPSTTYTISFENSGFMKVSHPQNETPVDPVYEYEKNSDGSFKFKTSQAYIDVPKEGKISDLLENAKGDYAKVLSKVYGISDKMADAYGLDGTYTIDNTQGSSTYGQITLKTGNHTIQLKFNADDGTIMSADNDGLTKKANLTFGQGYPGLEAFGFQAAPNNAAEQDRAFTISIDFSNLTNYNTNGSSTIKANKGDIASLNTGRAVGEMNGISVSTNGSIFANYSNGQTKLLGQIATAEFANASGLSKEGDNLYTATLNSGEATIQDITTDGGYMNTGVLEMSNVDLSSQFTEMITTQRGFQANSRIITVSDTLLEELTNLKR